MKLTDGFPAYMSTVAAVLYDFGFEHQLANVIYDVRLAAMRMLYQRCQDLRYLFSPGEKLRRPITDEDPNFDPYGPITREKGSDSYDEFVEIGQVIEARFAGLPVSVDTLVNRVRLPNGALVDGVRLHRGAAAAAINRRKNDKYGFAPGDTMYFTETARAVDRAEMFEAAMERFATLAGWRNEMIRWQGYHDSLDRYADAMYLLFQSPQQNRGSDSVIRLTGVIAGRRIFGVNLTFPQDVDVRAHSMEQGAFRHWLREELQPQMPKAD